MNISRAYIIALLIIASSITIGQIVMQNSIRNNQLDSYLVNISGRQRMLSQKIAKSALLMAYAKDSLTFSDSRADLAKDLETLTKSHNALQFGDPQMGIPAIVNSEIIQNYFTRLQPRFEQIETGVNGLLGLNNVDSMNQTMPNESLNLILVHQKGFLDLMNDITFQYDKEAQEHINGISRIELLLYAIAIILLIIEAFVIFRPAIRKLKQYTDTLVEQEKLLAAAKIKKQYINELESKNHELQAFSYITSHDLQEPLKTISGFSELLTENYSERLDDNGRKILHYISESAEKSSDMIRDLLFYTQVGQKRIIESVDCNSLLDEIQTSHKKLINESGTTIQSNNLPTIEGFKAELKVLFQNLLTNAIKYRKIDTPQQLSINYVNNTNHHLFTFSDKGIGIAKAYHQKIFLIFKRIAGDTDRSGTGIGLAMCKKIAETHGGSIWVTSSLGEGSIFHVSLPKSIQIQHQNLTD